MITELTAAQAALVAPIRAGWMPACLSTEPADRAAAEEALADAYACAGLDPPARVVWTASPLGGQIQAASMGIWRERERGSLGVDDEVWELLLGRFASEGCVAQPGSDCGESVLMQIREATQGEIERDLKPKVSGDVWCDVKDALSDRRVSAETGHHVYERLVRAVHEALGVAPGEVAPRPIHDVVTVHGGHGQHDAWWFACFDFFEQIGMLESTEALEPVRRLARACGPWWAFENAAVLSERPRILRLDEQQRPHSQSGPALEYPDGFGFHAWHGARVPAGTVIDVDALTVERIEAEPNGMLRSALLDRFGVERYLGEKGAMLAHREGRWGSIYHVSSERECSALHQLSPLHFMSVPVFVHTARQAWAWRAQMQLSAFDDSLSAPFGVG